MRVFITGATGYIGGSVATKLRDAGHEILGLARSDDAAAALRKRGIEPLRGDINAYSPFVEATKRVDAVINAANSDNPFVVHALLDGLAGSGKTLIQTSGSSVVGAYDNGEASDDTFDEDTPFTPEPEKAGRVAIDQAVLAAAKDGVRSIVIRPTLIYGRGIGVSSTSVQLPKLIDVARKHGVPRHVGRGLNIWSHVHIADVVDLFLLALDKAPAGSLFYAENGEASFKSVAQSIGRMLGMGDRTQDWPIGEAVEGLGPGAYLSFGSNSRVRGVKSRALGWKPKQGTLADEIERGVYAEVYGRK
ncbi:MAG: NAD-dependent epimerase/dehydratase family protein [Alphaproteobacteria bacterium]|nr:MAG: NAD-dependent epimerase/dehydratase family protein [Alphaproteobacteria bacterium]